MNLKEDQMPSGGETDDKDMSITASEKVEISSTPPQDTDKDGRWAPCRVCQCYESDRQGDAALGFLNIYPPQAGLGANKVDSSTESASVEDVQNDIAPGKNCQGGFVEFVSPEGERFVCSTDIEAGPCQHQDKLINLGCSCKSDLAIAHYACALKWFISRGSTVCEICGSVANNIQPADFKKVMASLKEYEDLRKRTATGELTSISIQTNLDVDPDAVAAIRRQRLSEILLWFSSRCHSNGVSQVASDQASNAPTEIAVPTENPTTKWAVESTGILVATVLLTITLAWLIAPRVGQRTAKNGLHILLGGICALTIVVFLRFIVLSRIKYGPARYWAILFVFWFLFLGYGPHGHMVCTQHDSLKGCKEVQFTYWKTQCSS